MTDERDERTGQTEDVETGDPASTTGASGAQRGEHVGRVAGADAGYAEETGAERRSEGDGVDDAGPL